MRIDCEVKLIHEIKGRIHYISDNKTNIIGKGINFESALDCYHRGMDLLQQKAAGIDINFDIYYLDEKEKEMASFENSTVVTTAATNNKKTYEQGLEEAWEIARNIAMRGVSEGGYSISDLDEIFGKDRLPCTDILRNMSIHEVKAKIDAWEAKKNIPKLGDVVELINVNNGSKLTGIYYGEGIKNIWVLIPEVKVPQQFYSQTWNINKTGKHFDIASMLDEIKEVVF